MKISKSKIINLIILIFFGLIIFSSFITKKYNIYPNNKPSNLPSKKIVIANTSGTNGNYGSGLGNQFFIYSHAYTFAKKIGAEIFIKNNSNCNDTIDFKDVSKRCYGLHKFGINDPVVENLTSFAKKHNETPYIIDTFKLLKQNKHFFKKSNIFMVQPIFHSKKIVKAFKSYKTEIKNLFKYQDSLSEPATILLSKITDSHSVSVHIRRGDFIPLNRSLPLSYQIKAMYFITNKIISPTFFIFSDDKPYVKEYLANIANIKKDLAGIRIKTTKLEDFYKLINNSIFVSQEIGHSLEEFHLMSQCKHNITTNSTFSWWAAFLNKNPNKIVIAPLNPPKEQAHPIPPSGEGWIELPWKN